MCIACSTYDLNEDLVELKEMIEAARKELGSINPEHLKQLDEFIKFLEADV